MCNIIPTIDMAATGRNIMRLREAAGLTVKDLQDIFGFTTPQAIYKWQHGTAMPTIDNLVALSSVLGVPMDEIIVINLGQGSDTGVPELGRRCQTPVPAPWLANKMSMKS